MLQQVTGSHVLRGGERGREEEGEGTRGGGGEEEGRREGRTEHTYVHIEEYL